MTSQDEHHRELETLLERWCEQRLSAPDAARLEKLVLSDPRAMQRYLDSVHLHGNLHWDTAVSDETEFAIPAAGASEPPRPSSQPGPSRHRASKPTVRERPRWAVVTACASLLVTAAAGLWIVSSLDSPADRLAGQAPEPDTTTGPESSPEGQVPPRPPKTTITLNLPRSDSDSVGPTVDQPPAIEPQSDSLPIASRDEDTDVVTFIDRQLANGWESADVRPSAMAEDAEWLRRASLDLVGHIPTLETLAVFVRDGSPRKRTEFVERLLAGDEYAQHFTTVWSHQLVGRSAKKGAERHGIERFLVRQFRENRPWNETVAEFVAAKGSVRENGAAGFLLAHLNNQAVPATAITARLFLGQQMQCTQCHKHPWNDWTQQQFWSLNAFFQQARIRRGREPVLVNDAVGGPTYFEDRRGVMQVTYPVFADKQVDSGPATDRRRELATLLSDGDDTQLARAFVNRTWAYFFGYGFTNPIDDMGPHHPPTHPELLERLSREFVAGGYDVRQLIHWITGSRAYHLSSRFGEDNAIDDPAAGDPPLFSRMPVKTLTPEQVYDSLRVAAAGEAFGTSDFVERRDRREAWVQQFFDALDNEENGEDSTFGGSLTQALTMMNGQLLNDALSAEPGTVLERILTSRSNDVQKIQQLCRAALSREPTPQELSRFRRIVRQARSDRSRDPQLAANAALRDIYWAYLNSSEFVTNR